MMKTERSKSVRMLPESVSGLIGISNDKDFINEGEIFAWFALPPAFNANLQVTSFCL